MILLCSLQNSPPELAYRFIQLGSAPFSPCRQNILSNSCAGSGQLRRALLDLPPFPTHLLDQMDGRELWRTYTSLSFLSHVRCLMMSRDVINCACCIRLLPILVYSLQCTIRLHRTAAANSPFTVRGALNCVAHLFYGDMSTNIGPLSHRHRFFYTHRRHTCGVNRTVARPHASCPPAWHSLGPHQHPPSACRPCWSTQRTTCSTGGGWMRPRPWSSATLSA